ncbi:MAG: nucleotide pyrophosphohydrolase [Thermoplasmatota archaeon]
MDGETTIAEVKGVVQRFISDRDWNRFHKDRDVSMALSVEASELLDLYLWDREPNREDLEDELADIFIYLLDMSHICGIDLSDALHRKMEKNSGKYPVDIVKGRSEKYTHFQRSE